MSQKQINHRARVEAEAVTGLEKLIASKLRQRDYGQNLVQAQVLADCARGAGEAVVSQLLKHYTIRERKARS